MFQLTSKVVRFVNIRVLARALYARGFLVVMNIFMFLSKNKKASYIFELMKIYLKIFKYHSDALREEKLIFID